MKILSIFPKSKPFLYTIFFTILITTLIGIDFFASDIIQYEAMLVEKRFKEGSYEGRNKIYFTPDGKITIGSSATETSDIYEGVIKYKKKYLICQMTTKQYKLLEVDAMYNIQEFQGYFSDKIYERRIRR